MADELPPMRSNTLSIGPSESCYISSAALLRWKEIGWTSALIAVVEMKAPRALLPNKVNGDHPGLVIIRDILDGSVQCSFLSC
jgi:hypothetical protein